MTSAEFILNTVVLSTVCLIGIIGNVLCFVVLSKKLLQLNTTLVNLLRWLAILDSLFLLMCITNFSLVHISTEFQTTYYPYMAPYLFPPLSIFYTASMYNVVGVAVERYISIAKPNLKNQGAFLGYIFPILVFSVLYNFPRFFELEVNTDHGRAILMPTAMMRTDEYRYYLITTNLIFTGLLPCLVLVVLSCIVSRELMDATHSNRDRCSGFMLSSLVVVLVVCHAPRNVLNIYELILRVFPGPPSPPPWMMDVNHIFLALTSSCNLQIFLVQDPLFRCQFKQILCCFSQYLSVPSFDSAGSRSSSNQQTVGMIENELKNRILKSVQPNHPGERLPNQTGGTGGQNQTGGTGGQNQTGGTGGANSSVAIIIENGQPHNNNDKS